jgi:hypothetical protein
MWHSPALKNLCSLPTEKMNSQLELALLFADFAALIVEPGTSAAVLNAIKARAIKTWGEENWFKSIVNEYVRLEQQRGGEGAKKATYVNRRNQIDRAFEVGSCNLETAMLLAAAVGCRFQMVCTEVQIQEF